MGRSLTAACRAWTRGRARCVRRNRRAHRRTDARCAGAHFPSASDGGSVGSQERAMTAPGPFGDPKLLEELMMWTTDFGAENAIDRFHDETTGAIGYGRPSEHPERVIRFRRHRSALVHGLPIGGLVSGIEFSHGTRGPASGASARGGSTLDHAGDHARCRVANDLKTRTRSRRRFVR